MATFDTATGQIDGSISPVAFLRADTLAVADGTAVSSINDTSGGTAWAQATSTRQPLFKTNIFGTKPALRFDGVDDFLTRAAGSAFSTATAFFVFRAVTAITTAAGPKAAFTFGSPGGGELRGYSLGADTGTLTNELVTIHSVGQLDRSAYTVASGTFATATTHMISARWNSGTTRYDIFRDGGSNVTNATTGTPAQMSDANTAVGASPNVEFAANLDVGVILIYATVLSDAQKAAAHSWAKDVWGATAADYDPNWSGAAAASLFIPRRPGRGLILR